MQADGVPLPVRELGIDPPLKLYQLRFYVRECDLDGFATSLTKRMQRPTVAYITAASHSGKSASAVVGFLRFRELDFGDDARLNFTHYLYMPFANNSGNYHDYVDEEQLVSGCRKSSKLRVRLYMRVCFRAQTFDRDYVYVDEWHLPNATPTFITSQNLLEKDVSTFMRRSPKGVLLVHVDEHRPMCPDPDLRRGSMRVLAELAVVQALATYTDIPPLPKQKSSETFRRPIACLLPDAGTIMKERLSMDDIDMDNAANLLRVAALRATLGLAL